MSKDDDLLDKASKLGNLYSANKLKEIKEEQEKARRIQEIQLKQQESLLREQKRLSRQQAKDRERQREDAINDEKERINREEIQELTKYLRSLNLEIISDPINGKRKLDAFFKDPLFLNNLKTAGQLISDSFTNLSDPFFSVMANKVLRESGINETGNTSTKDSLNLSLDHFLYDSTGYAILDNLHLGPKKWIDGLYQAHGLFQKPKSAEEKHQETLEAIEDSIATGVVKGTGPKLLDKYNLLVQEFESTIAALSNPSHLYSSVIQLLKNESGIVDNQQYINIISTHLQRVQMILNKTKGLIEATIKELVAKQKKEDEENALNEEEDERKEKAKEKIKKSESKWGWLGLLGYFLSLVLSIVFGVAASSIGVFFLLLIVFAILSTVFLVFVLPKNEKLSIYREFGFENIYAEKPCEKCGKPVQYDAVYCMFVPSCCNDCESKSASEDE